MHNGKKNAKQFHSHCQNSILTFDGVGEHSDLKKRLTFLFQKSVFYNIISEVKMFEFFRQKQTQDFSKTGKFLEIFDAKIREF